MRGSRLKQHLVVSEPPQPVPPVSRLHRRSLTVDRFPRLTMWAHSPISPSGSCHMINACQKITDMEEVN